MCKNLIVGANGTIGTAITHEMRSRGIRFDGTFSSRYRDGYLHLDLREEISTFDFSKYSNVIISAGVAGKNVEQNPDLAQLINIKGTIKLIDKVHESGGKITFISSSSVFSSKQQSSNENIVPSPNTYYGKQKLEIEKYLISPAVNKFNPIIIRPTKVLSGNSGLIKNWLENKTFETNKAVTLSPISDKFLAKFITDIQEKNERGIFHLSGKGILDYQAFAEMLISNASIKPLHKNIFEDISQSPDSATHLTTIRNIQYTNSLQTLDEFFKDIFFN